MPFLSYSTEWAAGLCYLLAKEIDSSKHRHIPQTRGCVEIDFQIYTGS